MPPKTTAISQASGTTISTRLPSTRLLPNRAGMITVAARTHTAAMAAETFQSDVAAISIRPGLRRDLR